MNDKHLKPLFAAILKLLRPLVRMFLHFNITYPVLSQLLKAIYVEVAERDFPIFGKPQSDSRITLLTGIHFHELPIRRIAGGEVGYVSRAVADGQVVDAECPARGVEIPDGADAPVSNHCPADSE